MNFKLLKELVAKNWFQVIIITGLFAIMISPKINIKQTDVQDINKQKLITQVPITNEMKESYQASVNSNKPINDEAVLNQITPIENPDNSKEKQLLKNKDIIIAECIRIEPDLSEWTKLNYSRKNIPTIDYITNVLEQEVGVEYLYSDIQRGVKLILKKIGR
jgi:hypothetical protein